MTEAQRHGQIEAWVDPATSGQQILTSYNGAMTNWSGSGDSELFMCQALYGFWTAIAAYGVASERKRHQKAQGDRAGNNRPEKPQKINS